MATLSIYYSYSKHPTDTHFGISVLFDWPWTRSPSVNDFCTCKEGNTEYTPNDVDSFLSISVWHVVHDHSLRLTLSRIYSDFASIQLKSKHRQSKKPSQSKNNILYTRYQTPSWLLIVFFVHSFCTNMSMCRILRVSIENRGNGTWTFVYCVSSGKKKSLYTQKALVITSRIVLRHIFMTEQT